MFSSSTANTLMSPFPQYYFPSSSPYYQPFQPLPQPQPQPPLPPPPSPPPPIPSLILNPNDNIFLHQSHQYNHLFSLANAQIPESTLINLGVISNTTTTTMANIMTSTSTTSSTKQDLIINCGGSRHSAPNFIRKKPGAAVSKKDRHSKIYTAQGLRDRRVRLSIDIAREFFDLHDMLGFDKASKTLEWLLTKSKKAIKEVSRSKLRTSTAAKSSTTLSSTGAANSDHYEQAMSEMNELVAAAADHDINLPTEEEEEEDHNSPLVSKQKLIDAETLSEAASMNLLEKDSRAKARARARTRAKEKRHNNYCTTTTSTTAYTNNNHKIRSSNYDNKMEKCSSGGGSSSHQISNHQLLIRSVLLNQLDHHQDIDHGQIQRLTPNSVEDKGLLFRMQANHDHDQDDEGEEEPVLMIKKKLYDHRDDHEEGQFCGISSKGGASNNVVYSSSPSLLLTQNWDNNNRIGTASPHPAASFCLPT